MGWHACIWFLCSKGTVSLKVESKSWILTEQATCECRNLLWCSHDATRPIRGSAFVSAFAYPLQLQLLQKKTCFSNDLYSLGEDAGPTLEDNWADLGIQSRRCSEYQTCLNAVFLSCVLKGQLLFLEAVLRILCTLLCVTFSVSFPLLTYTQTHQYALCASTPIYI